MESAKYCAGCGRSRVTKTLSLFSRTLLWTDCKADNYNETREGLKCRWSACAVKGWGTAYVGRTGLPGGNGVIIKSRQNKERRILSKGYGKDFTSYDQNLHMTSPCQGTSPKSFSPHSSPICVQMCLDAMLFAALWPVTMWGHKWLITKNVGSTSLWKMIFLKRWKRAQGDLWDYTYIL